MHPAKADGQNDMPFGRDTHMVPSNIVLDRGPGPPWGDLADGIGDRNLQSK